MRLQFTKHGEEVVFNHPRRWVFVLGPIYLLQYRRYLDAAWLLTATGLLYVAIRLITHLVFPDVLMEIDTIRHILATNVTITPDLQIDIERAMLAITLRSILMIGGYFLLSLQAPRYLRWRMHREGYLEVRS